MTIQPMALLKVIAALTPLMSDKEIAPAMIGEVKAVFDAMAAIPPILLRMDQRLAAIEEKLQGQGLPLSAIETALLIEHNDAIPILNGSDPHG